MAVEIGVSFDGFSPLGEAVEIARRAVEAGAASLWMAEHLGYRESLTSCMAYLLATPGAAVVPTAISPYIRHPMPTAMGMATLAEAGPGRVRLAVGVGNPLFLQESGLAVEKPLRAIHELVEALRALWSGQPVQLQGGLFALAGARMAFTPPAPIPIYLCPMKEQMLKLSGRIGDGVCLSAGLSPGFVRHSLALTADGARAAGRDPDELRRAGYIYFLAAENGRAAIETLRQKIAFLFRNRYLDDNIRFSGIPIDQDAIIAAVAKRDLEGAAKLVPDDAVEAFAVGGTPRDCRNRLEAFIAAGLDEPVLVMTGRPEDQEIGLKVLREFAR